MTDQEHPLESALAAHERRYREGIDRLRELAPSNEVYDITVLLGEALELVACLRRLARGRSADEIHRAFGAPGDFGYETEIGAALARLYRGESA